MTLDRTTDRSAGEPQYDDADLSWASSALSRQPTATPLPRSTYGDATDELVDALKLVCRRRRVSVDEETDFVAWVILRLLESDYALFKKFAGRSELRSYLHTTAQRLFLDYRISKWGKYSSSTVARRLGKDAVELERYTYRDGFTPQEAVRLVRTNHASERSEECLSEILQQLPLRHRTARRVVSLDTIETPSTERGNPERRLITEEIRAQRRAATKVLMVAIGRLSTFEKTILKLHFVEGIRLREIARRRAYPEAKLYREFARLKKTLRERLHASGVEYQDLTKRGSDDADNDNDTLDESDDGFLNDAFAWRRVEEGSSAPCSAGDDALIGESGLDTARMARDAGRPSEILAPVEMPRAASATRSARSSRPRLASKQTRRTRASS